MIKTKKIATSLLAGAMALSCMAPAFALDASTVGNSTSAVVDGQGTSAVKVDVAATTLSVEVPLTLPVNVAADGTVVVASDAKIVNNSFGAVKVDGVKITATEPYKLVGQDYNFAAAKVGSPDFNFAIDTNYADAATGVITVSDALGAQIDGTNDTDSDTRAFTYDVKFAAQKEAITDATVASVMFTVGWAE